MDNFINFIYLYFCLADVDFTQEDLLWVTLLFQIQSNTLVLTTQIWICLKVNILFQMEYLTIHMLFWMKKLQLWTLLMPEKLLNGLTILLPLLTAEMLITLLYLIWNLTILQTLNLLQKNILKQKLFLVQRLKQCFHSFSILII